MSPLVTFPMGKSTFHGIFCSRAVKSEHVNSALKVTTPKPRSLRSKALPSQKAKKIRLPNSSATPHNLNTHATQVDFFRPLLCDKKRLSYHLLIILYKPQQLHDVGIFTKPLFYKRGKWSSEMLNYSPKVKGIIDVAFGIWKTSQATIFLLLSKVLQCFVHNLVILLMTLSWK